MPFLSFRGHPEKGFAQKLYWNSKIRKKETQPAKIK
jgi:hypothetical protein